MITQVKLSEEEISALEIAGLPIPTTLPLTKVEQNALRDVRKNKQAAKLKNSHVSDMLHAEKNRSSGSVESSRSTTQAIR